ncbi:MAG: tryptophan synthase subunit alpha [Simkaniaceae bacterium]|nr:MAG: tryptophan synthase subunit alpha [Simkaniaceae bacterium]
MAECFKKSRPYIGYITAGDGGMGRTLEVALALVKGGVDLLEVGIPFSDPIADGPVIQEAMDRSLEGGTTPHDVLSFVEKFRKESDVPIVLFTYYNPLFIGGQSLLDQAAKVGVDGLLVVDLPLEEGEEYQRGAKDAGLDTVFLIAPSTPKEKIKKIAAASSGFLYYVCRKGTTGTQEGFPEDLESRVKEIKEVSSLPVVVGFGISNKEMATKVLELADGFVVGSLFVDAIGKGKSAEELTTLTKSLKP